MVILQATKQLPHRKATPCWLAVGDPRLENN